MYAFECMIFPQFHSFPSRREVKKHEPLLAITTIVFTRSLCHWPHMKITYNTSNMLLLQTTLFRALKVIARKSFPHYDMANKLEVVHCECVKLACAYMIVSRTPHLHRKGFMPLLFSSEIRKHAHVNSFSFKGPLIWGLSSYFSNFFACQCSSFFSLHTYT